MPDTTVHLPRTVWQQGEQQHAFQCELVELRRVAGQLQRVPWKDHGPGHIAGTPPEFLADKVSQPAQRQAQRYQRGDKIQQWPEAYVLSAGEYIHRQQHPKEAAVEGHAALPDPKNPGRVLEQAITPVKQAVTQSST